MASDSRFGERLALWQATRALASDSRLGERLALGRATRALPSDSRFGERLALGRATRAWASEGAVRTKITAPLRYGRGSDWDVLFIGTVERNTPAYFRTWVLRIGAT